MPSNWTPRATHFGPFLKALAPFAVFICVAFALWLGGEFANEFSTGGSKVRSYDLVWILIIGGYLIASPIMVLVRLQRRELLKAVPWFLITLLSAFRVFAPESYRNVEYRVVPHVLATILNCEAPTSANSASTFVVCYAYQRFPWERFLIRSTTDEMLRPIDQWSDELKASLRSNPITRDIVDCGYRRIASVRPNYLFVEVACG